jgi:hypothetical protein
MSHKYSYHRKSRKVLLGLSEVGNKVKILSTLFRNLVHLNPLKKSTKLTLAEALKTRVHSKNHRTIVENFGSTFKTLKNMRTNTVIHVTISSVTILLMCFLFNVLMYQNLF